jgi:acetolactate synthase-1/2/3 large subunit
MNASDLLVWYIEEVGTEYIFGIPGGVLEPLNVAIHNCETLQGITTRHEQGAAFMADGYARVSHKLGVCCATAGPGATNLITGIASSYTDSVPVLALTGQVSTKFFGKGAFQESSSDGIDLVGMFKLVTKNSAMIANAELTGDIMRRTLRTALTGRPGPVHLNLPVDVMRQEVELQLHAEETFIPDMSCFDRVKIKEAAQLLLSYERPVILVGNGITTSRAADELISLAELLQIPVVTTPKAKGVFPEDHPLSLGVFGVAGTPQSERYLLNGNKKCTKKIDGLLAIATSFNEWGTHTWDERLKPAKSLIQIDIDPHELGNNFPFSVAISGDARVVLKELLFEIKRQLGKAKGIKEKINYRRNDISAFKAINKRHFDEEKMVSDAVPILPQRLMEDINNACPDDTIFFIDIGNNWAWATHYLKVGRPYSFFTGLGFASMGYGAAASIGGKLAEPDKPVIAICGDGGFLMNGNEIATAVDYDIAVIWIILNDSQHGMIYHGKKMLDTPGGFNTQFKGVDFVKMAEAFGATGIKITKPGELNQALINQIIESKQPTIIDVQVDPEEAPPISSRIETLET